MKLAETAKLFVSQALWKGLKSKAAGRVLIHGLASSDESNRIIAGMFLVQSGKRAAPLLREALDRGASVPLVLRIIADIGAKEFQPDLEVFARSDDPQIAAAAKDALRLLQG